MLDGEAEALTRKAIDVALAGAMDGDGSCAKTALSAGGSIGVKLLARGRANAFGTEFGFGHVRNSWNVLKVTLHLASDGLGCQGSILDRFRSSAPALSDALGYGPLKFVHPTVPIKSGTWPKPIGGNT